jgi:hypothetical protein
MRRESLELHPFLLSLCKGNLGAKSEETVVDLCRRLDMAEPFLRMTAQALSQAAFFHLGFEQDRTASLYKVYRRARACTTTGQFDAADADYRRGEDLAGALGSGRGAVCGGEGARPDLPAGLATWRFRRSGSGGPSRRIRAGG